VCLHFYGRREWTRVRRCGPSRCQVSAFLPFPRLSE
jgi:hypothetical protein